MSNFPFAIDISNNINPGTPGAYLINAKDGSWPIFCSINDYNGLYCMNDLDKSYILMPGYKLEVYENAGYDLLIATFNAMNVINLQSMGSNYNHGSSCKLYYKGVEIKISGIS